MLPISKVCSALRPGCRCCEALAWRLPRRVFSRTGRVPQSSAPLSSAPHTPAGTTSSGGSDASQHAARCVNASGPWGRWECSPAGSLSRSTPNTWPTTMAPVINTCWLFLSISLSNRSLVLPNHRSIPTWDCQVFMRDSHTFCAACCGYLVFR